MTEYLVIQYLPCILLALLAGLLYWWQERSYSKTCAAYERIIIGLDARVDALLDRLALKQNLPPLGVNATAQYQEREEQRKDRKNWTRSPQMVGPVDAGRKAMALAEKREIELNRK